MPLHVSRTMCSSSGDQNCIIQHLVSSYTGQSITAEPNCLVPENNCILYLEIIHLITCTCEYLFFLNAHPSGRVVYGVGLRQLAFWYCEFETRRGHGCLSVVSVVCCLGRGPCNGPLTHPEESYRM